MKPKNFAVIAAYNESKNIVRVLDEVKNYVDNVVVVDDGSDDSTSSKAGERGVTVLKHIVNLGKGAAVKTGCDFAIENGADNIVLIDADLQHDARHIPEFLKKLEKNDVILGYRKHNKKMPGVLKFGNWFLNKTIRFLYGIEIKDSQCGYRVFTADAYKKIRWKSTDYSMESEMIARMGKHKLKYDEIPIETIYADRYKGTTVLDGVKIAFNLIMWRINN